MVGGISVIVPTYRRGEELDGTLLPSLRSQGHPPLEIIIVDDTEDDSVRLVCEKWAPRFAESSVPFRYTRNPGPRSTARAKNLGASHGQGDILLFLDSDVELSTDYIKEIASAFSEHADAVGIQGLITNWADTPLARRFLNKYGGLGSEKYRIASGLARDLLGATVPSANSCRLFEYPVILDRTIECQWLSGSNLSVRKPVFDAIRFDREMEGYSLGEDILLSRRLAALGKLYITPMARCSHSFSPSGGPQRSRLGNAERTFFRRLLGLRGDVVYFNRSILFPLLGYSEDPPPSP